MSEYELSDYAASVMSNFLSAMTIYISVITAYVAAAFVAGDRLTKLQLVIVNTTFTIAAGVMGVLSYFIFARFFELARLAQIQGSPAETPLIDFGAPLAILVSIMYLGSIVFMWSIRKKSGDA